MRYTVVADDGAPIDAELAVPASKVARGEQLNWLLEELEDLLQKTSPSAVWVKKAGAASSHRLPNVTRSKRSCSSQRTVLASPAS